MKTILAVVLMLVASVATAAECVVCSPGTTPAKYRATFSGGGAAVLFRKDNCTWVSPLGYTFEHAGPGANQAGGLFAKSQSIFRASGVEDVAFGRLDTADVRDGNGPFAITVYDKYGNALYMVTLTPTP